VTGDDVDAGFRTEYNGQYVYFCCSDCQESFLKDAAKYIARMSADDREAIKVNEKCPVSADPTDKSKWVEYEGRKLYFCCSSHIEQFKKDHKTASSS
jgi:YHS domain-containing protein